MTQRYLNNTFYSLLFFALQSLISLCASPFIIATVGKEGYGIIVVANTLSAFGWLSFMDLGLQGALTKHLAAAFGEGAPGRERAALLFHGALTLYLGCGLVAGVVVASLSWFPALLSGHQQLYPLISRALLVVAGFNALIFPLLSVMALAEGLQEYRAIKLSGAGVLLCWALAVFLLVRAKGGVLSFLVIDYLKTLLQYLVLLVLMRRRLPWLTLRFSLPRGGELRSLAGLSLDLLVSRITGLVFNQTDVLIITLVLGEMALVTDYYSANTLFMALLSVAAVFNTVVVSESASTQREDAPERLVDLALVGTRTTACYVLPIAAALFVWAPEVLQLWLGEQFARNATLLRIMILALLPVASSGIMSTLLVGINRLRGALWIPLLSVVINLLVSIGLVGTLGIPALGLGTTTAYLLSSVLYNRYCFRILKVPGGWFYRETLARPALLSLAGAGLGFLFKEALVPGTLVQLLSLLAFFVMLCYGLIWLSFRQQVRCELLSVLGLGKLATRGSDLG